MIDAERLQKTALFKTVDLPDLQALLTLMKQQNFSKGRVLFEENTPGDAMYIVLSGYVRIYGHDEEGHEITIIRYGADEIFGELSLLDEQPRSAGAIVEEDAELLILTRIDFLAFLNERPLFGLAVMKSLAQRVRYSTNYLEEIAEWGARLSQGDFDQVTEEISTTEPEDEIQQLIAAFLGMVRSIQQREETLTKGFTKLPDDSQG